METKGIVIISCRLGGAELIGEKDIHRLKLQGISRIVEEDGIARYMHCCTSWGKLYRRSLLVDNQLRFEETLVIGEDLMFTLKCLDLAEHISVTHDCVYNYYVNDLSLTHKMDELLQEKYLSLFNELNLYVKKNYRDNIMYKKRMGWFLVESMNILLNNYIRGGKIVSEQLIALTQIYNNNDSKEYLKAIRNKENWALPKLKHFKKVFWIAANYNEMLVRLFVCCQIKKAELKKKIKKLIKR